MKKGNCCYHEEIKLHNNHLLRLERYAIENFIHDPINVFFSLKEIEDRNESKEINDFLRIDSSLRIYQLDSIDTFLNRTELDNPVSTFLYEKSKKNIKFLLYDFLLKWQ